MKSFESDNSIEAIANEILSLVDIDGVTYRRSSRTGVLYHVDTCENICYALDGIYQRQEHCVFLFFDKTTHLLDQHLKRGCVGVQAVSKRIIRFSNIGLGWEYLETEKIAAIAEAGNPWHLRTYRKDLDYFTVREAVKKFASC